ncbi:ATP-binding protein [Fulvivirga sp. M361]|uniref:ATP-binding protein n=1 Tax=Fulvivirga sp. M361 TaxID=2594266 RepID=UPI00162A257D|nr:ATP-binding protein [Fulvivirga sp. M361]
MYIAIPFLLAGTGLYFFMDRPDASLSLEKEASKIVNNLVRELSSIQRQTVPVLEVLENEDEFHFTKFNGLSSYPFFIYQGGDLIYWSDYRFVPDYHSVRGDYRYRFLQLLRKDFIARKWVIANSSFEVVALLPLYKGYQIENDFVASAYNPEIFPVQQLSILPMSSEAGTDICLDNNEYCLFKVLFDKDYSSPDRSLLLLINALYSIGFLLLFIAIYVIIYQVGRRVAIKGALLLAAGILLIRLLMLWIGFPDNFTDAPLFNSRYFASSNLNRSLGDLLINLGGFCSWTIYVFLHRSRILEELASRLPENRHIKILLGALTIGGGFFSFHIGYLMFQTLYHNSQLTFDIEQTLDFDSSRLTGFVIFLVFIFSVFFFFHVVYKLMKQTFSEKRALIQAFFSGAALFSLVNLLIGQIFWPALLLGSATYFVLHITDLPRSIKKLGYSTFLYFFVYVISGALLGTISIYQFENERDIKRKKKYASQLLIENDNLAEFLLSEANDRIEKDVFIQNRMSSPFLSKDIIKAKIRRVYLNSYFDKYDVNIYLYNALSEPFDNSFETILPNDFRGSYSTSYDSIYFINSLGSELSKRYLSFSKIEKRGVTVGYIAIDLNLKRVIPESVYPELLVDHRFLNPYQNAKYSYAVFENNTITYNSGDFNYLLNFGEVLFQDPALYDQSLIVSGYRHIAVRDVNDKVIVISSEDHSFSDVISNFSFLFLIQVFSVVLLAGFYALYFLLQQESLNYSAKIQLYLNVAFFLPLFAVSATTLSLINSSFEKEVNYEYYKKAENISINVSEDLNDFVSDSTANAEELQTQLIQLSKYSGADVNLFDTQGKLIATSQPLIYENDLLSNHVNPVAYAYIKERGENARILQESVGELDYNTAFFAVKSFDKGDLIGMVSIPFFQSEYTLEQNQITILTNVINIFTVVFIVFLVVSYLAAKWLTFPLWFITQKLKKTTLTGFNEPLSWDANDEIGLMVGEYNKMLENLENSKKALARSEKESAWREIAQQVAHEIKNPLTPMKLTLQHLSRKLRDKGSKEEMDRPINTLLDQVDILNDIASSFSSFAKMPIPEHERYELAHVVRNVVSLHKSTKNVVIDLHIEVEPVFTIGDEQLMGRIINNILLNAIQATERKDSCIKICLDKIRASKVRLEIKDNGAGIANDIRNKIFIPNFSTKEMGSGIGLAIAKHGVEHAGGKIWFETEIGSGTSFFIELPTQNS